MKRLIILTISTIYWILWTAAIPWFLLALNRKMTRIPAVRKIMIPQPSRHILRAQFKRQTPDQEFGNPLEEPSLEALRKARS